MNIKGVIFDLDGVIVSTDNLHYTAWKSIADEENIYFDHTINNSLRGVSRMESLDIILQKATKKYSHNEKLVLSERKNSHYVSLLEQLNESHILPGVINVLSTLKNKKVKIAIGSSSKNAKIIIDKIKIEHYFDAVVDGNQIENSKPHPEVFLLAAQKLNLSPQNCAVIEDAEAGVDAANAAGMFSFGIHDAKNYSNTQFPLEFIENFILYT